MNRPRLVRRLSLATLACALAFEANVHAADARPEAAAQNALKKAATDYRAKRYAAAGARLQKALGNCGDDGCSAATRASLLRDLGTMQVKQGDKASAQKSFADALALEPDLDLNARYDKPDVRAAWDEAKQHKTDTICPYCGVGCTLTLHTQGNRIVKVTSPMDVNVTHGHLCIKGRFGFEFVQNVSAETPEQG